MSRLRVWATVRLTVRIIVGSSRCTTLDQVAVGVNMETVFLTRNQSSEFSCDLSLFVHIGLLEKDNTLTSFVRL